MNVDKLIETFYADISELVIAEVTGVYCQKVKKHIEECLLSGEQIPTAEYMLYQLLDKIAEAVCTDTERNEQPFSTYYKGTNIAGWNESITQITKEGIAACADMPELKQCKIIARIERKIRSAMPHKRIAEILYYRLNHRYYNSFLEKAFRDIVEIGSSGSKTYFSKSVCNKIRKLTEELTGNAEKAAYEQLYTNDIPNQYRPSVEVFKQYIEEDTPIYAVTYSVFRADDLPYSKLLLEQISESSFCTLSDCHEAYKKGKCDYISLNTYCDYFRKHVMHFMGITLIDLNQISNKLFTDKYISKSIVPRLNDSIEKTYHIISNRRTYKVQSKPDGQYVRGQKFAFNSRFELINSLSELMAFSELVSVWEDLIKIRLNYKPIQDFENKYKGIIDETAIEELKYFKI